MGTKAKRHVHKYYRATLSFGKVWACFLSDCNHYMPQHMEELVKGKFSICWNCDEKFILTPFHMKQDKPICMDCSLFAKTTVESKDSSEKDESPVTAEAILKFVRS